MPRIFVYDNREFPDPDPSLSAEEVKNVIADFFPELANAEIQETKDGDNTFVEFRRRVGTKGGCPPRVSDD